VPVELTVVESVTELETTVVEVILESASEPGPAGPGVSTGGTDGQVLTKTSGVDFATAWEDSAGGGVSDHGALTGLADDDHTQYLKEKASGGVAAEVPTHTHAGAAEAGTIDHGVLTGLSDNDHPQYALAADVATDAELAAHAADTTSVHGITDTSVLATDAEVATAVSDHSADTTSVHGIADTSVLATDSEVATAVSDHSADTTSVHGIADTSALALTANHPTNATFNDHSGRHEDGGADEISIQGLAGTPVELTNHLSDAADAHDASAISVADAGGLFTATEVEAALAELVGRLSREFDYVERTASLSVTATSAATAQTFITSNAETLDGATVVLIEFFCPTAQTPSTNAASILFNLYDGSTDLGRLCQVRAPAGSNAERVPVHAARRFTPTAASHTYSVRAWVTTGTGIADAGAGGTDVLLPAFIRITRVGV
jgi:hypothetical protein